uniref:Ribosomal protein L34 n=1 Tax=Schimmelmannia schousboei TaxID=173468 RepID=A0A1C9C8R9_9FLOR|nr:ribosomal protein L34 [Schimmelmannia schousboei]AOM64787.1 ribosomal protein L34 [Schimmelmannia schousboei]
MSKGTLQGTKLKKLRKSGFRARMNKPSGKRIIQSRRSKGRYKIGL